MVAALVLLTLLCLDLKSYIYQSSQEIIWCNLCLSDILLVSHTMSCTKPKMSSVEIEELVELRVKTLEQTIDDKLAENNSRFEDLVRNQNGYEEDIVQQKEESLVSIENLKRDLMKSIDDGFLNNKKEFDKIFKENDRKIESQIGILTKRLDDIELVIKLERNRLNKVIEMSGFMAAEVEMVVKKREEELNVRISKMEEEVQGVLKTVSDVSHKVFDMDIHKKNNLIFNGIVQEEGESKATF